VGLSGAGEPSPTADAGYAEQTPKPRPIEPHWPYDFANESQPRAAGELGGVVGSVGRRGLLLHRSLVMARAHWHGAMKVVIRHA
jgi:hypothetical protein